MCVLLSYYEMYFCRYVIVQCTMYIVDGGNELLISCACVLDCEIGQIANMCNPEMYFPPINSSLQITANIQLTFKPK